MNGAHAGGASAWRRWALRLLLLLALLVAAVLVAFQLSPWPGALLIRAAFDAGAARTAAALQAHAPADVVARLDLVVDAADPDARLDVYLPPPQLGAGPWPVVVWVHGGGYVSGHRRHVGPYARVLAGQGFGVVAVDYTVAPAATYPQPLRQVNAALAYLDAEAARLGLDTSRIVLAGDSAGAHVAAQIANLTRVPSYAATLGIAPALHPDRLRAVLLFCGTYDLALFGDAGLAGWFAQTVLWAYSGRRDHADDPFFATASVVRHVTADFPPAFVSAGNADPLLPHSLAFAERLRALGVEVDTLFFAPDHQPALPHEYQFDLDGEAGQRALARAVAFLRLHLQP